MTDFTPVDHKEKSHSDRDGVFKYVQEDLGFEGISPEGASVFVGTWLCRFGSPNDDTVSWHCSTVFSENGNARATCRNGKYDNDKDRWELNEDGSFSYYTYVESIPEYGLLEPTIQEDRYHVLLKDENAFVLFNGDGSLVEYYERQAS